MQKDQPREKWGLIEDPEVNDYAGILFIQKDALWALMKKGTHGVIQNVALSAGVIYITWHSGDRTQLTWQQIQEKAGLGHLPQPVTAFISSPDVLGLLIRSATPRIGLTHRELHSVIHPIGVLTSGGLEPML